MVTIWLEKEKHFFSAKIIILFINFGEELFVHHFANIAIKEDYFSHKIEQKDSLSETHVTKHLNLDFKK